MTRAELLAEAARITAEIRSIDEKFFYEREVDRELARRGLPAKYRPKPVDPGEARARLLARREIERLLEEGGA